MARSGEAVHRLQERRLRGELNESELQDLGMADSVEAEAVGVPGKRTFKVTATSQRGSAVVWMEKEQLFEMAVAIKRILSTRADADEPAATVESAPGSAPPVEAEFKAGEMSLRHDAGSGILTLEAAPIEPAPEADAGEFVVPPSPVRFSFTRTAALALVDKALEAWAAGRKRCPLCGGPIDPEGHFCVKTNGHRETPLPPR